ncbi:hypothetical protein [Nocardioides antri]|uniref:Uncharacterized protein n=1 Tax=Nocardioides antri TaxID=2607659 RepID=A0A5B1M5F7_9ACTN|nr:hypothetical protein [Nocardioides antri]KAA1427866.1 hypothetical protein F0U47_10625 [Nocardioides antri]
MNALNHGDPYRIAAQLVDVARQAASTGAVSDALLCAVTDAPNVDQSGVELAFDVAEVLARALAARTLDDQTSQET